MTYSVEIIKKVLEIREKENLSAAKISKLLIIPRSTIIKWLSGKMPTGKRAPKSSNKIDEEKLRILVAKYPDMYLSEFAEEFNVTPQAIHYRLKKTRISLKKKIKNTQNQTKN